MINGAVGMLISLDILTLGIVIVNARRMATRDDVRRAERIAREAHEKVPGGD